MKLWVAITNLKMKAGHNRKFLHWEFLSWLLHRGIQRYTCTITSSRKRGKRKKLAAHLIASTLVALNLALTPQTLWPSEPAGVKTCHVLCLHLTWHGLLDWQRLSQIHCWACWTIAFTWAPEVLTKTVYTSTTYFLMAYFLMGYTANFLLVRFHV